MNECKYFYIICCYYLTICLTVFYGIQIFTDNLPTISCQSSNPGHPDSDKNIKLLQYLSQITRVR